MSAPRPPLLCRLGLHKWDRWRTIQRATGFRMVGKSRVPAGWVPAGAWRNCLRCEREDRRMDK